jgi:hypothetical protein
LSIFVVAALLKKPKQQHGKNQNKNTGLFINCIDFVVVRTKMNKKIKYSFFPVCLHGPCFPLDEKDTYETSKV